MAAHPLSITSEESGRGGLHQWLKILHKVKKLDVKPMFPKSLIFLCFSVITSLRMLNT